MHENREGKGSQRTRCEKWLSATQVPCRSDAQRSLVPTALQASYCQETQCAGWSASGGCSSTSQALGRLQTLQEAAWLVSAATSACPPLHGAVQAKETS